MVYNYCVKFSTILSVSQLNCLPTSGIGKGKVITHAEAKDGLLRVVNSSAIANYPDPNRIDDVRNFYEEHVKNADSSEKFIVWFG